MSIQTKPTDYIFIPFPAEIYAELIRRSGDPNPWGHVVAAVESDLDATEGDPSRWSWEYIEKLAEQEDDEFEEKFGNPSRGYQWQAVFLPNGTQVRMTYKGDTKHAEVRHEKLYWGDETMSPSQFARRAANNTSRNAWRDIYVKFPGDGSWKFADDLRRQKR